MQERPRNDQSQLSDSCVRKDDLHPSCCTRCTLSWFHNLVLCIRTWLSFLDVCDKICQRVGSWEVDSTLYVHLDVPSLEDYARYWTTYNIIIRFISLWQMAMMLIILLWTPPRLLRNSTTSSTSNNTILFLLRYRSCCDTSSHRMVYLVLLEAFDSSSTMCSTSPICSNQVLD